MNEAAKHCARNIAFAIEESDPDYFEIIHDAHRDGAFTNDEGMRAALADVAAAEEALAAAQRHVIRIGASRLEGAASRELEEITVREVLSWLERILWLANPPKRDPIQGAIADAWSRAVSAAFHPKCKQCGGRGVYGDDFCSADCEESFRDVNATPQPRTAPPCEGAVFIGHHNGDDGWFDPSRGVAAWSSERILNPTRWFSPDDLSKWPNDPLTRLVNAHLARGGHG